MVFLVSIIAMRGKEMKKQIRMIIKDLEVLKTAMPSTVMIGQLKLFFGDVARDNQKQNIRWRLKERRHKDQIFYSVKFDESYCILESFFMSVTDEMAVDSKATPVTGDLMSISNKEIKQFTAEADDPNAIHKGKNPVVPGLMILDRLLEGTSDQDLKSCVYHIKFLKPLFANDSFTIEKTKRTFQLISRMEESIAILTLEENNE